MKQVKKRQQVKQPAKKNQAKKSGSQQQQFVTWAVLVAITCIAFFPCLSNLFTNWDDTTYIVENPLIKNMSGENIRRIFSEVYFSNYQPLHLLSYLFEYHLFGLNASGYHWVSLLMHAINVLLVWWIARYISKNNYVAFFTALLFAVTPMRVESVAWAAERKDLLYSLFFFAALICYLRYQEKFESRRLLYTFLFFVLSVFSKTMAVSLVPVMFLVDYYYKRPFSSKVILEKIPFIILSVIMGLISVNASKETGSIDITGHFTFPDRLLFGSQNLLLYGLKLLVPFGLTSYYRYPDLVNGHIPMSYYSCGILCLALAGLLWWSFKKNKLLFFSIGFFISTVALVLMVLPVGPTIFSERYSYVPSVMFYFMLMYFLFHWIAEKKPGALNTVSVVLLLYSLVFIFITRERCLVWKDSLTLWTDVINSDPGNNEAFNNRANVYNDDGKFQLAIADFNEAIRLKPGFPEPYAGISGTYRSLGAYDSAFYYANRALQINPRMAKAFNNRGVARAMKNDLDSALADFGKALELQPSMFEVYSNRANLNYTRKNYDAALQDYDKALHLNPDFLEAYRNKGILFKEINKLDDAIFNLDMYMRKGGPDNRIYLLIGLCYAEKNDFMNAVNYGKKALDKNVPDAAQYIDKWNNHSL